MSIITMAQALEAVDRSFHGHPAQYLTVFSPLFSSASHIPAPLLRTAAGNN